MSLDDILTKSRTMDVITQTNDYVRKLQSLIEPIDILEKQGFIVRPLTNEELLLKRRCVGCGKALSQLAPRKRSNPEQPVVAAQGATLSTEPLVQISRKLAATTIGDAAQAADHSLAKPTPKPTPKPTFKCQYHPGRVFNKTWSCCFQHVSAKPCSGTSAHIPQEYAPGELIQRYQFHPTPTSAPAHSDVRVAVALDCEMGTAVSGDSEVIRVSLIDYFSGEVLVDNYVEPDVPMQHLNTRYSGVSWGDIKKAKRQGTCLRGTPGARVSLWTFIGPKTIVMGHGVNNDLRALRWVHGIVLDSFVTMKKKKESEDASKCAKEKANISEQPASLSDLLDPEQVKKRPMRSPSLPNKVPNGGRITTLGDLHKKKKGGSGLFSLKHLMKEHLQRDIQQGSHDSLEDSVAARDLIHWIIVNNFHV